jgi:hypothetical protein
MIVVPDVVVDGYARLLPVIEAFRADARYTVIETANRPNIAYYRREAISVSITGPSSIDDIEKRFVLPADLAFNRENRHTVHLWEEGIGITFQPPSSKWWQGWRAWEGYPRGDETAGDHTVH